MSDLFKTFSILPEAAIGYGEGITLVIWPPTSPLDHVIKDDGSRFEGGGGGLADSLQTDWRPAEFAKPSPTYSRTIQSQGFSVLSTESS